jgi:hypothetical protein
METLPYTIGTHMAHISGRLRVQIGRLSSSVKPQAGLSVMSGARVDGGCVGQPWHLAVVGGAGASVSPLLDASRRQVASRDPGELELGLRAGGACVVLRW